MAHTQTISYQTDDFFQRQAIKVEITFNTKTENYFTCVTGDRQLSTSLKVKEFHSNRLLFISGSVDDGPTATLTKNVLFLLRELQLCLLQKQPNTHTYLLIIVPHQSGEHF